MLKRSLLVFVLLLALASLALAQEPDSDGDTVPDAFDSCRNDAGIPENSGCPEGVMPDFDGDGVGDQDDLCYDQPGNANLLGCTPENFPDFDADTVADPLDACFDQPGSPANTGCPEGVTPDLDGDGVADAQDACPREYGFPENNGCQPDADSDTIPDFADACPEEAGSTGNYGCPEGAAAPDADGDGVPDMFDQCRDTAGTVALGGCPDADNDGVQDAADVCPGAAGDINLLGCAPLETVVLPSNRAAINSSNAAQARALGALVLGTPTIALSRSGVLAAQASERVLVYNLNAGQLSPIAQMELGSEGTPVAVSADGQYIATVEFPPDFSAPPFVQIRSGLTLEPLSVINAQQRSEAVQYGVGEIAFSPTAPVLALTEDPGMGFESTFRGAVNLRNVADGTGAGELLLPDASLNIAFSPDGTRLATDTVEGGGMVAIVWDVASASRVATIQTTPVIHFLGTPLAFSPDGVRLAVGKPDGTVSLYDTATSAQAYSVPAFDQSIGEVVSAVAFSPDGSVIAAAGGVPYSGGLTGNEVFPIVLLDAASGAQLARIETRESLINNLLFSADGTLLVTSAAISVQFYGVG